MKTREIVCQFYICKGSCAKGKNAAQYGICQHCKKYRKKEGAAPARTDKRKQKLEKIRKRELRDAYQAAMAELV